MAVEASPSSIAKSVLLSVGGKKNVRSNSLCMTRLRLRIVNPDEVDDEALESIPGVLGLASRGFDGLEVVFGPRLVRDVYNSFVELTGLNPEDADTVVGTSPLASNLRVRISPSRQRSYEAQSRANNATLFGGAHLLSHTHSDVDDLAGLSQLFEQDTTDEADVVQETSNELSFADDFKDESISTQDYRLLIINGPNINMLGIREPDIYGHSSYDDLLTLCKAVASEAGFSTCSCFQSNHEGDIVDRIQDAYQVYDGIIINPGALTHTSIALLDALRAVDIPTIEVHISEVDKREAFRQISYVRGACFESIVGLGVEGYAKAIRDMAAHLNVTACKL